MGRQGSFIFNEYRVPDRSEIKREISDKSLEIPNHALSNLPVNHQNYQQATQVGVPEWERKISNYLLENNSQFPLFSTEDDALPIMDPNMLLKRNDSCNIPNDN